MYAYKIREFDYFHYRELSRRVYLHGGTPCITAVIRKLTRGRAVAPERLPNPLCAANLSLLTLLVSISFDLNPQVSTAVVLGYVSPVPALAPGVSVRLSAFVYRFFGFFFFSIKQLCTHAHADDAACNIL